MCDPDREEYSYRFWGIDQALLSELQEACSVESQWNEDIQSHVACVSLMNEASCCALLSFLSDHPPSPMDHGVYISLVTDSDQAGFSVPDYILHLLREYNGSLDVSFIMV